MVRASQYGMSAIAALCLLAVLPAAAVSEDRSATTPVAKVVQMLGDMLANAQKEKKAEEVSFASFSQWCTDEQARLTEQVQIGAQKIESLTADSGKESSDASELGEQITKLHQDLDRFEGQLKAQVQQREANHKEFVSEQRDYAESIDALDRAINVMQKQNFDRAALLQLGEQLPANAQQMLTAFVGMMSDEDGDSKGPDFMSRSAPEADAYEFQSGNIVDLLKKLRGDFVEKKSQCEKEEMNSKHAHEMVMQDLTASITHAKQSSSEKSIARQGKLEQAAMLKKQLSTTSEAKEADDASLSKAKVECDEKKLSFEEKQKLRAEEIEAIHKAIEILSSEDVQALADKRLGLAQRGGTSLAQFGVRGGANSEGIRRRVMDFLSEEAERLHSQQLTLIAEKVAADPFVKVRKLISDMITRLLNEANADAKHEGFCDKEMGQSKLTRNKLSEDIDALNANIENGKASITMLGEDIARLTREVADLKAEMSRATELRAEEKKRNEATIKDATDGGKAIDAATSILKEFYAQALKATAFTQVASRRRSQNPGVKMGSEEWNALANPDLEGTVDKGHKEGMQTFGDRFTGAQTEANSVLAMLEVISSDFSTLKADTQAAEVMSQKSYDEFIGDAKKNEAVKSRKIELSKSDKTQMEAKLHEDTADMKFSQDKLLAAERYYEQLEPQCMDKGMTFKDRAAARQAEIQSLKEALQILNGADISGA